MLLTYTDRPMIPTLVKVSDHWQPHLQQVFCTRDLVDSRHVHDQVTRGNLAKAVLLVIYHQFAVGGIYRGWY